MCFSAVHSHSLQSRFNSENDFSGVKVTKNNTITAVGFDKAHLETKLQQPMYQRFQTCKETAQVMQMQSTFPFLYTLSTY